MSTPVSTPDTDTYFRRLEPSLPTFSLEDQHTAIAIYRELAKGEPVGDARLATALEVSLEEVRTRRASSAIDCLTYTDGEGRIIGFGGLAAVSMHHEFIVNERKLWTWCAWDSLFIPELLGAEAQVVSADPRSTNPVRLWVKPDGVRQVEPEGAEVSFVLPDAEMFTGSAENVMSSFCHYVFFFESRDSGEAWAAEHPGTVLFTVDEAVQLARRLNARNFGDVLGLA